MVGPLLLMKLLHCKRKCPKQNRNEAPNDPCKTSNTGNECDAKNKNMEKTCRICLRYGDIPIYGKKTTNDIPAALKTLAAVEIKEDDPHPKYICDPCHTLLQGAVLLRETAQQSDQVLNPSPVETKESSDVDNGAYDADTQDAGHSESSFYQCIRCDIDFDNFKDYSQHKLSAEHENKRKTCPICHNSYTAVYIKKHLLLHKLESPYMCDVCGKKFVLLAQFKRHRLTHFYDLPFKCELCPYRGRFSESLKMHMRTHTGEKPYQCSECAARFVNKSNLNKHMFTHKKESDHIKNKCDSCNKGFYTKGELNMHIKVNHAGIKDHVCNICNKAFGYRKQMMKHQLKVHKRQKLRNGRLPLYLQIQKMNDEPKTSIPFSEGDDKHE